MARTAYELTFRGDVPLPLDAAFGGMKIVRTGGRTVLHGPLPDLRSLQELIDRLRGAGLELLHVRLTLSPENTEQDPDVTECDLRDEGGVPDPDREAGDRGGEIHP